MHQFAQLATVQLRQPYLIFPFAEINTYSPEQSVMPFGVLGHLLTEYRIDDWEVVKGPLKRYGIWIALLYGLRRWCAGGTNHSLRHMASKVVIITVQHPPLICH